MDKQVDRVTYSAIVSDTGEQVNELQHTHYVLHRIEAQTPSGARIEPRIEHIKPSPEIQAYYAEYVWDAQGDGK